MWGKDPPDVLDCRIKTSMFVAADNVADMLVAREGLSLVWSSLFGVEFHIREEDRKHF